MGAGEPVADSVEPSARVKQLVVRWLAYLSQRMVGSSLLD
jgi:hypothetical protein